LWFVLKERELLQSIKGQMQTKIDEAFEQLCLLQEIRQQIVTDLQNKNITLEIDIEQYNITVDSNGVTFKPDPTRAPKGYPYIFI
jgi:tektin-2